MNRAMVVMQFKYVNVRRKIRSAVQIAVFGPGQIYMLTLPVLSVQV